jgi:hypothetical protein
VYGRPSCVSRGSGTEKRCARGVFRRQPAYKRQGPPQSLRNSPRRILYVAMDMPDRGVEKMTLRMLLESTLRPGANEKCRKTDVCVCRMLNTERGRKASQSAERHRGSLTLRVGCPIFVPLPIDSRLYQTFLVGFGITESNPILFTNCANKTALDNGANRAPKAARAMRFLSNFSFQNAGIVGMVVDLTRFCGPVVV